MRFQDHTLLSALFALDLASASTAATVNVTVDFKDIANVSVANLGFSHDDSLNGQVIGYCDLSSFMFSMLSQSYDLTYVLHGPFVYNYMAFNTATQTFNISIRGEVISDIYSLYESGFFVSPASEQNIAVYDPFDFRNYTSMQITPSNLSAVPLPASLPLVLAGIGALAAVGAKRKRKAA